MTLNPVKLIKRYPNRKLYDPEQSSYVTLDQIAKMIRRGKGIRVVDYKSGEDLTSVILAQILLEAEKAKRPVLPLESFQRLLRQGGESLQGLVDRVSTMRKGAERELQRLFVPSLRQGKDGVGKLTDLLQKRVDEYLTRTLDRTTGIPSLRRTFSELERRISGIERRIDQLERATPRGRRS